MRSLEAIFYPAFDVPSQTLSTPLFFPLFRTFIYFMASKHPIISAMTCEGRLGFINLWQFCVGPTRGSPPPFRPEAALSCFFLFIRHHVSMRYKPLLYQALNLDESERAEARSQSTRCPALRRMIDAKAEDLLFMFIVCAILSRHESKFNPRNHIPAKYAPLITPNHSGVFMLSVKIHDSNMVHEVFIPQPLTSPSRHPPN